MFASLLGRNNILVLPPGNVLYFSGRRLEWPRSSIPRTVKKLSWDEELEQCKDREVPIFMDLNTAVTPESQPAATRVGQAVHLD